MPSKETIVTTVLAIGKGLAGSSAVQKFLCGTYSNGKARSLPDALTGEIYSPSQKKHKKDKKNKKKGKKKKKKKNKKKSIYFDI